MHDYGLFQAIESRFEQDEFLGTKLQGLFSQTPLSVAFPHALLRIQDVVTDSFRPPKKLSVDFALVLFSRYRGFKEVHRLMSRVGEILDASPLTVKSKDSDFTGNAVLRLQKQQIKLQKDELTREGIMEYQAWLR
ncbi:MAG: hypothetical protein ABFQ95_07025 [Pseudomonadota bacterium]